MIRDDAQHELRALKTETVECDFVVVGGGLAGTCAAIQAARAGVRVTLVQDRPVLGGNASSEVRLWALGATSHMGNNNRWSREGGLIDEILVENVYRNPEGNTLILDTILIEKVLEESNIRMLLNTAVDSVVKGDADQITSVSAYCSQNQVRYELHAPLFCDASGDGIVGFQAGAAFRMGAETPDEFNEGFAPDQSYGELLGHTIYFYTKDIGRPVNYVAPSYALKEITKIPRFKQIRAHHTGCNFWWIEYGGRRDTIHETEAIKFELWSVVYGIWDYVKNSGKFPEAQNLTLEWVGTIPGKRESRRFEGDHMLTQKDVVEQVAHPDAVSTGGWSLDLHPSDGVYTAAPGCNQFHSKGVYGIPYRCYYSRNISNLFVAGRIISSSHVAFGSSRVLLTCAHGGSAVGMAAAHCVRDGLNPRDLTAPDKMSALQDALNRVGQSIPNLPTRQAGNLATNAAMSVSSTLALSEIPGEGTWHPLNVPIAQLVPWEAHYQPSMTLTARSEEATTLRVALRVADKPFNFTPEITVDEQIVELAAGEQSYTVQFKNKVADARYAFITFYGDAGIELETSAMIATGLVSVLGKGNDRVAVSNEQIPPEGIGIDRFEFWTPERRPEGKNLALKFDPPLVDFASADHLLNGYERPLVRTNAWIADLQDESPTLTVQWDEAQVLHAVELYFDTDFDHAMETAQWGHPENIMPTCVREFSIETAEGTVLADVTDNHSTRFKLPLAGVTATGLRIKLKKPGPLVPAALFGLHIS